MGWAGAGGGGQEPCARVTWQAGTHSALQATQHVSLHVLIRLTRCTTSPVNSPAPPPTHTHTSCPLSLPQLELTRCVSITDGGLAALTALTALTSLTVAAAEQVGSAACMSCVRVCGGGRGELRVHVWREHKREGSTQGRGGPSGEQGGEAQKRGGKGAKALLHDLHNTHTRTCAHTCIYPTPQPAPPHPTPSRSARILPFRAPPRPAPAQLTHAGFLPVAAGLRPLRRLVLRGMPALTPRQAQQLEEAAPRRGALQVELLPPGGPGGAGGGHH